jgi:tryptophanyl-tRNA synthetase
MAADILIFNAHSVPVGRDQVQHIEMARDIGQRFNHLFGEAFFTLPEAAVDESVATLPGLDGRKMSKSYDNTIPLFEGGSAALREAIMKIVTDSRAPGEPKDPQSNALHTLFAAFASADQADAFAADLRAGLAWGEAKQRLFETVDGALAPMRARYASLIADPDAIEAVLIAGAAKARAIATPFLARLRAAVGLRPVPAERSEARAKAQSKAAKPAFKQYRESDGRFYFKLTDADGQTLLQSDGHASPREAGQLIARLKSEAASLHRTEAGTLVLGESPVGQLSGEAMLDTVRQALTTLAGQD